MIRLAIAVLSVLCLLAPAQATLASRHNARACDTHWLRHYALTQERKQEFHITEQTQIELDGRPCSYEDVPKNAVIIRLEVESDRNPTILKIQFRSKR